MLGESAMFIITTCSLPAIAFVLDTLENRKRKKFALKKRRG